MKVTVTVDGEKIEVDRWRDGWACLAPLSKKQIEELNTLFLTDLWLEYGGEESREGLRVED